MSLRTLSVLALAAAMQLSAVEAHVRLLYTGTPIRNANSAVTDGQYSVNGPCGGQQTFARNGQKTVTSGQALALKVAYNGDHRSAANAFRVTMQCTAPGGNVPANDAGLRGNTNLLPNSPNIPAADSSTAGYAVNLNLPAKPDGTKCTLAVLDQREWGGCIDMVYGAAAPATTKPPTAAPGQITTIAPTTPSMYAGDVVSGMWSIRGCLDTVLGCCCMKGTISVQHASGAATASATGTLAPIAGSPSTCPAASSFTTSLTGNEVGVWSAVGVTTTNSQGDTFEIQGLNKADAMWEVTNVAADKPQICSMAVMKGAAAADPVNDPNNIPTATTPAPAGPDTTSAPSNPNTNAPTQTPTTTRPVKPSVGAAASVSASAMLVALLALAAFFLAH